MVPCVRVSVLYVLPIHSIPNINKILKIVKIEFKLWMYVNIHNSEFMNNFPNYLTSYASRFWLYNFICTHVLFFFRPISDIFWMHLYFHIGKNMHTLPRSGGFLSVALSLPRVYVHVSTVISLTWEFTLHMSLQIYSFQLFTFKMIFYLWESLTVFLLSGLIQIDDTDTYIHVSIKCKCIKYSMLKIQFKNCSHIKITF